MAQSTVNFRMDDELKRSMEAACQELGLSMSAAFTLFAKKVAREKRIPFDVAIDPFYSPANMAHLRRGVRALNAGQGEAHELLGDDQ